LKAFPAVQFYCPPEEVIITELSRPSRGLFNLIHHETSFNADIYFAGNDELQQWVFKNRKPIEFSGFTICVAPPEYVILKKLEFYKGSGRTGHKHITDIRGILANSDDIIDHDFLQKKFLSFLYLLNELYPLL
jgi:hypothetical protein